MRDTVGDRVRTFRSPQGRHARVASRDCCAIRIGSFIPIPPSRVHTVCLYILPGASIERVGPFEVHARMVRSECCSSRGEPFIPRPGLGPILFCSCVHTSLNSFAKRRDRRGLATGFRCGRKMGTCMRPRSCCSQNLSSARNMRVHTLWSYFLVGRLLVLSLLRRSRGTLEVQLHIWDLSSSRFRARVRMVVAVRFGPVRSQPK